MKVNTEALKRLFQSLTVNAYTRNGYKRFLGLMVEKLPDEACPQRLFLDAQDVVRTCERELNGGVGADETTPSADNLKLIGEFYQTMARARGEGAVTQTFFDALIEEGEAMYGVFFRVIRKGF